MRKKRNEKRRRTNEERHRVKKETKLPLPPRKQPQQQSRTLLILRLDGYQSRRRKKGRRGRGKPSDDDPVGRVLPLPLLLRRRLTRCRRRSRLTPSGGPPPLRPRPGAHTRRRHRAVGSPKLPPAHQPLLSFLQPCLNKTFPLPQTPSHASPPSNTIQTDSPAPSSSRSRRTHPRRGPIEGSRPSHASRSSCVGEKRMGRGRVAST